MARPPVPAAPYLAGAGSASAEGLPLCVSIGVVGEPNLGKSSFINALFGSKVVSRSATPGHTKHLQSLYLNHTTAVIDCPGVIFPRADVPPGLQVLLGSTPIAQLREPYSALRFWAERVQPRLHEVYALRAQDTDAGVEEAVVQEQDRTAARGGGEWAEGVEPGQEGGWSPFALAEAFATKKRFHSKGGRPDVPRVRKPRLRPLAEPTPGSERTTVGRARTSCCARHWTVESSRCGSRHRSLPRHPSTPSHPKRRPSSSSFESCGKPPPVARRRRRAAGR